MSLVGRFLAICLLLSVFFCGQIDQTANAQNAGHRTDKPVAVSVYLNEETMAKTPSIKSLNPEVGFNILERKALSFESTGPEVIKSYIVRIEIQPSGDLDIIETITVHADQERIKRGILRDMPRLKSVSVPGFLPYSAKDGVVPYRYRIRSVTRNGRPETFVTEKAGPDGERYRVKIGRAWDYLDKQDYVYEIAYSVKDEIRRFEKADELYWNVIGTGWAFPIENAQILIIAPEGLTIKESHIFTGRHGETNNHATLISKDNFNRVILTRPLNKGEGITVSLIWPEDSFGDIPFSTNAYYFTQHHKNGLTFSISSLIFFLYCLYAWFRYGRDPKSPPVFPEYFPPKGYSAAAVNHAANQGTSGHRAFIATLKSLQVKKYINLRSIPSMTEISFREDPFKRPLLDEDELTLFNLLFPNGETETIKLRDEYNSDFHVRYESFLTSVRERYDGRFHRGNGLQIFFALTLGAGIFIWVLLYGPQDESWVVTSLAALLFIGFVIFCFNIGAPTKEGVALKAKIDGLDLYLSLTDEEKINAHQLSGEIPTMSNQRYREILPYAVAMNMEKPWTQYFNQVMPHNVDPYQSVENSTFDDIYDDFEYDHMNNLIESSVVPPPPPPPPPSSSSSSSWSSSDDDYSSSYSTTDTLSSGGGYSGGGGGGYSGGGGGGGGGDGW